MKPHRKLVHRIAAALAGCCMLLSAGTALASLMDLGDRTRDSDTGLEWLDITESVALSFNAVSGEFGPGGAFEGFRHATVDELVEFWTNAGIPDIDTDTVTATNFVPIRELMDLVGTTESGDGITRAFATHDTVGGAGHVVARLAIVEPPASSPNAGIADTAFATAPDGTAFGNVGHWLVMATEDSSYTGARIVAAGAPRYRRGDLGKTQAPRR